MMNYIVMYLNERRVVRNKLTNMQESDQWFANKKHAQKKANDMNIDLINNT